jgi:hypothetical protein
MSAVYFESFKPFLLTLFFIKTFRAIEVRVSENINAIGICGSISVINVAFLERTSAMNTLPLKLAGCDNAFHASHSSLRIILYKLGILLRNKTNLGVDF